MLADELAHIRRGMATAFCYRRVERGAKRIYAQLGDGVAHGIFRRRKSARGDLGLNPLSGVRRQFDFHGCTPFFPRYYHDGPSGPRSFAIRTVGENNRRGATTPTNAAAAASKRSLNLNKSY